MKKLLIGTIIALTVFSLVGCSKQDENETKKSVSISANELDPAVWGKSYPLQYKSYLKNNEHSQEISQFIAQPLLPELFKGYGFAKEYNETKGHTYSLADLNNVKRVNEKTTAACLHCHTAEFPSMVKEQGIALYAKPYREMAKKAKHPIACADCHDSKTMKLKVTRPGFINAMKRKGVDLSKATEQEMRTYVCAQCHVEYYFDTKTKEVVYPWDNGYSPDQIEKYYEDRNFSDWEHPDSKAKMLKAQHPDFETFQSGTHGSAGVSCSDCHMPYQKIDGQKITSHWWTSPLNTVEESCKTCHSQETDWLVKRVKYTQEKTDKLTLDAEKASNEAHKAVQKALATPGSNGALIKQAQALIVKGQFRWDFVAAENSSGFHNPTLSLDTLGKSIDYSRQAQLLAERAIVEAK